MGEQRMKGENGWQQCREVTFLFLVNFLFLYWRLEYSPLTVL